jgi:hypothetical protein
LGHPVYFVYINAINYQIAARKEFAWKKIIPVPLSYVTYSDELAQEIYIYISLGAIL